MYADEKSSSRDSLPIEEKISGKEERRGDRATAFFIKFYQLYIRTLL